MNSMAKRMLGVGAAVALSMLSVHGAAAGTADVAQSKPHALIATTGDLYWTTDATDAFVSPHAAEVWRASKDNTPGSEQRLYREERTSSISFNSIVYAEVAGNSYVYFVANYDDTISYIKRIPLAGGPVTITTRAPYVGERDLKTDGVYLYWADTEGLRRVPIGGGVITTLFRTNTASQIGLDANYVYFSAGVSGSALYRVPKVGGAATIEAIASGGVTDLYVHETGAQTTLYWSEGGAAVKSYAIGESTPITYQPADIKGYRIATAVGFDGSRVLWTTCLTWNAFPDAVGFFHLTCDVMEHEAGVTRTLVRGENFGHPSYNSGASNLVFDTTQVFWGRDAMLYAARGLMKYVHTFPPSVSIDPALITAIRQGSGGLTRTASAVVSNGEPPYVYSWSIDNGAFSVHNDSRTPDASIYAALAACDAAEGTLFVTVTDAIGRSASASAEVMYTATRPPHGVCD